MLRQMRAGDQCGYDLAIVVDKKGNAEIITVGAKSVFGDVPMVNYTVLRPYSTKATA